jgi:thiol-disulfide isomerase/thioredoxin
MRGFALLLFSLILFTLILFTGCSKKNESGEQNMTTHGSNSAGREWSARTFLLSGTDHRECNLTMNDNNVNCHKRDQTLLLINLFASWCPPCRAEIPALNTLQRKYAKDLFIIGILVNDEQNNTQINAVMNKYGGDYFVSGTKEGQAFVNHLIKSLKLPENYPIPLSILYRNGKLYRYYEGAMPIEIMENEIDKALKKHKD